ncbi:MAG TPA: ABC transporter ATP-binding protein, partial [Gaiellaceae bacterium]
VQIKDLTKRFDATTALQGIDLEIEPGEFVSLIGPSGCGKSTLLRVIGDLVPPTRGSVTVNGKSAHQARLDRDYGIVFQDSVLFDWRTVGKNIALPLEMLGWDRKRRQERLAEMLELVELAGFEDHYPWQLSGGMQQRVAIARALAYQPSILLMDEPFASVDAQTRGDLEDLVLRVRDEFGVTVLFVTHDIDESVYLSDRVVVLTHSPTTVKEIVPVALPSPRAQITTKELPDFAHLRAHVYRLIKREQPAAELDQPTTV